MTVTCKFCNRKFAAMADWQRHHIAVHRPHRILHAKDRPLNRGDVPCGLCPASFSSETAARQHRQDKHGQQPTITEIGLTAYRNALNGDQ